MTTGDTMRIEKSNRRHALPRMWLAVALSGVALLAALGTSAAGRYGSDARAIRSADDFEWHGRIAPGKAIEVKGISGSITAQATTGNEVEVRATKRARKSDPEEVRIEVIEHAGGVTICAVYPSPRGEKQLNDCQPGEAGHSHTRNNDVEVTYTVLVPAGVRFIGRTVNGSIEARGLKADIEAYTVNGSVGIATRGIARAATVNGSIEAEMGTVLREPLEFETVNGGITLIVPASVGAELRATTVNGDIETDFPLTVRGKFNLRRVTGTIGRGGPQLMMTTVNGDIRLRSAS